MSAFLYFGFLIYEMNIIIEPSHGIFVRFNWDNLVKVLGITPTSQKVSNKYSYYYYKTKQWSPSRDLICLEPQSLLVTKQRLEPRSCPLSFWYKWTVAELGFETWAICISTKREKKSQIFYYLQCTFPGSRRITTIYVENINKWNSFRIWRLLHSWTPYNTVCDSRGPIP